MYSRKFDYFRPAHVDEAVKLLAQSEDAKLMAGGQSLIPLLKLRLASPELIVDIGRLPLNFIAETGNGLRMGALTKHVQAGSSTLIRERFPLITDAVAHIADTQVRNMGTVGGGIAEADPAGDWLPVMMALGATLRCVGPVSERRISAREFAQGPYQTALGHTDLLTEIELENPPEGSSGCYLKVERRAGGFALASAAVQLTMDGPICRKAAIVMGGVGPTALAAVEAEQLLVGETPTAQLLAEAAAVAAKITEPFTDVRASNGYRKVLVRALVNRALAIAIRRCHGEEVEANVLAG